MTLAELNRADRTAFVAAVGWVFEQSPWVAERSWARRPFGTVADLAVAMIAVMREGTAEEQLALLRAHPDLGTRARMSAASAAEQSGAGLDQLSPADFERLTRLNAAYRERFGFPFLFAVKGANTPEVMDALERRVTAPPSAEWDEALAQVARIARHRLDDLVQ